MNNKTKTTRAINQMALFDIIILTAVIICSTVVFYLAGDFKSGNPGDGSLFPRLSSGVVLATATISLVARARSLAEEKGQTVPALANFKPIGVALMTCMFVLLLPTVGYPILAPLWMGATMWTFGMRSRWKLLAVPLGLSAAAWLLLDRLAFAPPPAGILESFLG